MSKTLLYLEDDEALAYVTKRALEKSHFLVHHFLSLHEFRSSLKTLNFDYCLLDLKIGQDTSIELISEIKFSKNVPIVILTGYGTVRTAVQAMKLGAVNFLSKPSSINEIIHALQEPEQELKSKPEKEDRLEKPSLKAMERESIQKALDENNGNVSAAARQLKMHRRTLQRKLQKRHTDS